MWRLRQKRAMERLDNAVGSIPFPYITEYCDRVGVGAQMSSMNNILNPCDHVRSNLCYTGSSDSFAIRLLTI